MFSSKIVQPFVELAMQALPWNAVRRIIVESDAEGVPFFGKGTLTVFEFEGRLFAVTARHVIDNSSIEHARLFVTVSNNSLRRLKLDRVTCWEFKDVISRIGKAIDIILYEIDCSESLIDVDRIQLSESGLVAEYRECGFVCVGCPAELNTIDYDTATIRCAQGVFSGTYFGETDLTVTFLVDYSSDVQSYDGVSGGACFGFVGGRMNSIKYAGVAIQGSRESKLITFIKAHCVYNLVARRSLFVRSSELI